MDRQEKNEGFCSSGTDCFVFRKPIFDGRQTNKLSIDPIYKWMKYRGNVRYQARHNSGRAKREDQVMSIRALTLWMKE